MSVAARVSLYGFGEPTQLADPVADTTHDGDGDLAQGEDAFDQGSSVTGELGGGPQPGLATMKRKLSSTMTDRLRRTSEALAELDGGEGNQAPEFLNIDALIQAVRTNSEKTTELRIVNDGRLSSMPGEHTL